MTFRQHGFCICFDVIHNVASKVLRTSKRASNFPTRAKLNKETKETYTDLSILFSFSAEKLV